MKRILIILVLLTIIILVGCSEPAVCGNNIVESGESCDNSACAADEVCENCKCNKIPQPPALPEG